MPLATTVLEAIAVELYERLLTLVDNADYSISVVEVIRPSRNEDYTPRDYQIVLKQGFSEEDEALMCPGNPPAIALRQVFNIHCHAMPSETSTQPIDEIVNTFAADVVKCVSLPAGTWHNFDGNAIDARWLPREMIYSDGGGIGGINVPIAITYRTDEDNPYNVRD